MNHPSLAMLDFAGKKRCAQRRGSGPSGGCGVVGCARSTDQAAPPAAGAAKLAAAVPLTSTLRGYNLQQRLNLFDPGSQEALYDLQSRRAFAGLGLGRHAVPGEAVAGLIRDFLFPPSARAA